MVSGIRSFGHLPLRLCCNFRTSENVQSEGNFSIFHKDLDDGMTRCHGSETRRGRMERSFRLVLPPTASPLELARAIRGYQGQFIIFVTGESMFLLGALCETLVSNWITKTIFLRGLAPEIRNQEVTSTSRWSEVELHPRQFQYIDFVFVHWAGWFDIFLRGHLTLSTSKSPPSVREALSRRGPARPLPAHPIFGEISSKAGHSARPARHSARACELSGSPAGKVDHVTFTSGKRRKMQRRNVGAPPRPLLKAIKFYAHGDKNSSLLQVLLPYRTTPGVESSSSVTIHHSRAFAGGTFDDRSDLSINCRSNMMT